MDQSRRHFIASTCSAVVLGGYLNSTRTAQGAKVNSAAQKTNERPLVISTWPFGKPANEEALRVIAAGGSALDGVEHGIRLAESDPDNSSVGLAGIPNSDGVVQLDASIMNGPGHKAGSVAALEGILHPITAARRVMEKTQHVMLVGKGAADFAVREGLANYEKISDREKQVLEKWRKTKSKPAVRPEDNHDTIALLVLGPDGTIAGGCSTSGWGGKLPGRVGDSPIIGGGLYVDNDIGAAGATGLGENVMRYCGSFLVVELMRQGLTPQEACLETIRRIAKKDPKGFDLSINFIALNKNGEFGAAGTGQGFQYSVTYKDFSKVLQSPGVTNQDVGPVGGNRK
ncbi:MAG: N(4)-(beta-N-acetylglucosaminyl)-L-asparaginase [Verrucomicrobiales bacterium]